MSETAFAVANLMIEDYERVIFYLLRKLGKDPDKINVVIRQGEDWHEFEIKKPYQGMTDLSGKVAKDSMIITPHVEAIEYTTKI